VRSMESYDVRSRLGGNTLIGFSRSAGGTTPGTAPLIFLYSTNMGQTWTVQNSNIDMTQTEPYGSSGLSSYQMVSPCIKRLLYSFPATCSRFKMGGQKA
jgi:hypothetical protein